jgi:hypothetical protein
MRRIIRMLALASVLGLSGCAQDPPAAAPDDFPLEVEFVPTAATFSNDDDLVGVLTNRSRGTIYFMRDCPTAMERREVDRWLVADLSWRIACPLDIPRALPLAPGASFTCLVSPTHLSQPVLPGIYRFPTQIGKSPDSLGPHWSGEFAVTE